MYSFYIYQNDLDMSLTIPPDFTSLAANTDVSTPKKIKNQREQNDPTYKYSNRETTQHRQHKNFFDQKVSPNQYPGAKKKSTLSFSVPHRVTITSNIWIIEKYNEHLKLDGDVIRATVGYINHCDSMAIALSLAQNLTKCTGKTLKYDCGPYNACLSRALKLCSLKELPVRVDEILTQMRRFNVNHNDATAINLLKIYKATKNHSEAQLLVLGKGTEQSYINVWKIDLNIKICNALMGVYGNLGKEQITEETKKEIDDIVEKVLKLIKDNKKLESPNAQMLPDAITANNLLGVHKVRKDPSAAKLLVFGTGDKESIIDSWGIPLNNFIYCTLFGVCANLDEEQITGEIAQEIDDIVERVLKLIATNKALESPSEQMLPDEITAVNLLGVYKIRKKPSAAKHLVLGLDSLIKRWGVPLNIKICNALLVVCANLDEDQITEKTEKEIDDIVERVLKLIAANKALESPNAQMLPNSITAVNLLGVYKIRKKTSAAKQLVFGTSNDLDVPVNFTMYANWVLVGKGQFSENLNGLCARGICDSKKGLFSGVLNCHAGSIFNQLEQKDAAFAVPFEFAKALYEYHYQQNANISQIITGYRSGNKLRSQFISYFKKTGLEVQIDKNNQGVLIIPANS